MCNCHAGMCLPSKIGKFLLIIGGINWGLVGVAMLMNNGADWNVIHMLLGSWPMAEGVVYVIVGLVAIMKIFGCKCAKCKAACAACSVGSDKMGGSSMGSM